MQIEHHVVAETNAPAAPTKMTKESAAKIDVKTAKIIQEALVRAGEDLGTTGKQGNGVDGDFKTKSIAAFEKVCAAAGVDPNKVDFKTLQMQKQIN